MGNSFLKGVDEMFNLDDKKDCGLLQCCGVSGMRDKKEPGRLDMGGEEDTDEEDSSDRKEWGDEIEGRTPSHMIVCSESPRRHLYNADEEDTWSEGDKNQLFDDLKQQMALLRRDSQTKYGLLCAPTLSATNDGSLSPSLSSPAVLTPGYS